MRLISATVRNYRVHREVTVAFDPARTLIGGPNESGKSTLIEAIHRALFLKAQVTGESQRSMVSRLHPGHPEVEIEFDIDGARYHLYKRFSGQNGMARLTKAGGRTWLNEDAETVLRGLLGVPEVGGGRGVADRARQQWAHLWVWQGTSSDDPCRSAREQNDLLLEELQRRGGAVVMQSEVDARVAARFAAAAGRLFVGNGRPRTGSDLEQATRELEEAEAARDRTAGTLAALRLAMDEYVEAQAIMARSTGELAEIERESQRVAEALARVAGLREEERGRKDLLRQAVERLAELRRIESDVQTVRDALLQARSSLDPQQPALAGAETERSEVSAELALTWKACESATAASRRLRQSHALAAAALGRLELRDQCADLEQTLSRIRSLEGEIEGARRDLVALPPVTDEVLERLRGLDSEAAQARAALTGVAAELEVIVASCGVSVDGQALLPEETLTITEPADVCVGDVVTLRVRPGGGAALAQARDRAFGAAASLDAGLDAVGVKSVREAGEAWALVRALQSDIDRAQAALDALTPEGEDPVSRLSRAGDELAATEAELQRLLLLMPETPVPATRAECEEWLSGRAAALRRAEAAELEAGERRQTVQNRLEEVEQRCADLREAVAGLRSTVVGLEAQERYLLEAHGDDPAREKALTGADQDRNTAAVELEEVRGRLEQLQAQRLEADQERLQRAHREVEDRFADARTAHAVACDRLRLEGTRDPYADLAIAEARLASAREHHHDVRRRAEAVRLLDRLFAEEQRALSELLSRPLAGLIESYVQCLFGPEARVTLGFDESGVTGIALVRPGECGATGFEILSEGTREQVAAAVRLAVAELLAAGAAGARPGDAAGAGSGTLGSIAAAALPVVFDDACAYSDPERVLTLQRMLDLAASRGLQVIVLTCNPSDYASLGARQVTLRPAV